MEIILVVASVLTFLLSLFLFYKLEQSKKVITALEKSNLTQVTELSFLKEQHILEIERLGLQNTSEIESVNFQREKERESLLSQIEVKESEIQWMKEQQTQEKAKQEQLSELFSQHIKDAQKLLLEENIKHSDQGTKKLNEVSQESLSKTMLPFKQQLEDFKAQLSQSIQGQQSESLSLKKEVQILSEAHQQTYKETQKLTTALHGHQQSQGKWGEVVLKSTLESSGLREGHEFYEQGKGLNYSTKDSKVLKPDVILKLPNDRFLMVDSKVSLSSYTQYLSLTDPVEREKAGKEFIKSVKMHIKSLSSKQYQENIDLETLDFVLMFVATDGIMNLASELEPNLYEFAFHHNVFISSPSTLMPILRSIHHVWQRDRQNKNVMEIAKRGGLLHDKFTLLYEDLEKIKKTLGLGQSQFEVALNKVKYGKGNLLAQVDELKKLGAKASKSLPQNLETLEVMELSPNVGDIKGSA